jgi:hypothetical protein
MDPNRPQPGRFEQPLELLAHVGLVERRAHRRGEHKTLILPLRASGEPRLQLPHPVCAQSRDCQGRERDCPLAPARLRLNQLHTRPLCLELFPNRLQRGAKGSTLFGWLRLRESLEQTRAFG